ncbi:12628_t:CDS:2 [Gigaspora margarita]|uniref:12628_t:CDS:1 n=1 Tax=Gigaspora margarita TaxID=4874 RepID=A0ABN7UJ67_GIGMA|nr:12628_t:CDS:2 [Gigaspora margarita]
MKPKSITIIFVCFIIVFLNSISANNNNNNEIPSFIRREPELDRSDVPKNILAASLVGGYSQLTPMMEVCKILKERGYNVTLVAPGNFTAKSIAYRSIPQIITGPAIDSRDFPEFKNLFTDEFTYEFLCFIKSIFNKRYISGFNELKRIATDIKADLFICGYSLNEPCFDLAWKLKKPVVAIGSSMMSFSTPFYKSDPIFGCKSNMENESFYERFRCSLIMPLGFFWSFRHALNDLNYYRAKVGVEPSYTFQGGNNILFLADNFFGFETPFAVPPLHQDIGPILPDIYPDLAPSLSEFLEVHPRTMYFTLGTQSYTTPKNYIILLQSFIELINQNILDGIIWSTVKTNISELPPFITLSSNISIPTSNILNNLYPNFYVTNFASQFALLSHKNLKIYLSHGGASSCHESMYTATPMLMFPLSNDQEGNTEKLVDTESAKRMQILAKVNSKRKYRGADLIEVVLNSVKYRGNMNDNGEWEVDNNVLLKDLITPDTRMGFIKGKYLDVLGTGFLIIIILVGSLGYSIWKFIRFVGKLVKSENFQVSLKSKKE